MKKFFTWVIPFALVAFPTLVLAATTTAAWKEYTLLAPILGVTKIESFGDYLGLLFRGTIGVAAVLAVVMIVTCGIKLMTAEAISSRSEAKGCIGGAIGGLLLAIASWLILNTINPALLNTNLGITLPDTQNARAVTSAPKTEEIPTSTGWYFQYQDTAGNKRFQPAGAPSDGGEKCEALKQTYKERGFTILSTTISGVSKECFLIEASSRPVPASELAVRDTLCGKRAADGCIAPSKLVDDGKVYINKRACSNTGTYEANCTSVGGLAPSAISMIQKLASDSGCAVVVSGGTELGHAMTGGTSDHKIGNATFDLRHGGSCFDKYIKSNGLNKSSGGVLSPTGIPSCPGGRAGNFCGNLRWYLPGPGGGFWFVEERYNSKGSVTPHWHVCQQGATGKGGTLTPYCNDPK